MSWSPALRISSKQGDWVPGSRVLQMAACRPCLEAKVCAESRLGIAYTCLSLCSLEGHYTLHPLVTQARV